MVALTHSTLVPFTAQEGKEEVLAQLLAGGHDIVLGEPLTQQWYAAKLIGTSPAEFIIFDTFPHEDGRTAHLTGPAATAFRENAPTLLIGGPKREEIGCEILAHKVTKAGEGLKSGLTTGLRVLLTAKPEKKETVKKFLIGALPLAEGETGTISWYAIHWPGTDNFGVVDFFSNEEGREAHLQGPIAAALMASVEENLTGPPDIAKLEVLAAKVQL
jgi:quinol monooxygenase YgiN